MSKSKVTQISSSSGSIQERIKTEEELSQPAALTVAFEKWEDELKNWKGIPWAKTRADLVGDFVRAACADLENDYAGEAGSKAAQMMGSLLVKLNKDEIRFIASSLRYQTHIALTWNIQDESLDYDSSSKVEPSTEFTLMVEENAQEEDVREALKNWGNEPQTRMVFDPITQLSNEELRDVMKNVESQLDTKEDHMLLVSAASVLLNWKRLERLNASSVNYAFHGLTEKNKPVAPGKKIVVKGEVKLLDQPLKSNVEEEALVEAKVHFKPFRH